MVAGEIFSVREDAPMDDNDKRSLYDITLISPLIGYRRLNDLLRRSDSMPWEDIMSRIARATSITT